MGGHLYVYSVGGQTLLITMRARTAGAQSWLLLAGLKQAFFVLSLVVDTTGGDRKRRVKPRLI